MMGTWGAGVFENDAASDGLGQLEKHGILAIPTPLSVIGEYANRNKIIPTDAEQSFLAMCEVVAIAGGITESGLDADQLARIRRESRRILEIPHLKQRIIWVVDRLDSAPTALEHLWDDAGEGDVFRFHRDRAKHAAIKALTPCA